MERSLPVFNIPNPWWERARMYPERILNIRTNLSHPWCEALNVPLFGIRI